MKWTYDNAGPMAARSPRMDSGFLRALRTLRVEIFKTFSKKFAKRGWRMRSCGRGDRLIDEHVILGVGTVYAPTFTLLTVSMDGLVRATVNVRYPTGEWTFGQKAFSQDFHLTNTVNVRRTANLAVKFLHDAAKRDIVRNVMTR